MELTNGCDNNISGESSTGAKCLKRIVNDVDDDIIESKRQRIVSVESNKQDICGPNLCDLPDELLVLIFSYLDNVDLMDVCLTCERFFDICYEKSLWKIINIRGVNLTDNIFNQYMNFIGPHTEEIHIIGDNSMRQLLTFDNIYQIKVKCPNLQVLRLENQAFDALELYVSVFPSSLRELSLADSSMLNNKHTQRLFSGIDVYFTNLEILNLSNCYWFSTHSIMAVSKLPNLKYLYLDGCSQLYNFMPYLSLSTRYGFKHLEVVDLSRTFVSDSEVSCFNATKNLRALYLERKPDSVSETKCINFRDAADFKSKVKTPKLCHEYLKAALTRAVDIIPFVEYHLNNMNTPKSRILKANYTAVIQELSKSYTKIAFYRLYLSLECLEKLVSLEVNIKEVEDDSKTKQLTINAVNKIDFVAQTRLDSIENIEKCDKLVENSNAEIDDAITKTGYPNCAALNSLISSCLNPRPSCSNTSSLLDREVVTKIICANAHRDHSKMDLSKTETPLLDKDFIIAIRRLTGQPDAFNISDYHDMEVQDSVNDNTVIIGLGNRNNFDRNTNFLHTEISVIGNRTVHALFNPRADCTNLERVSFRGYKNISDEALFYLSQATQTICFVDLRGTAVTSDACARFQSQRPWCELKCDFQLKE